MSIIGTRPEAIKMAPVISALGRQCGIEHRTCITGQHLEMLDSALDIFAIKPDINLGVMEPKQSLNRLFTRVLDAIDRVLNFETPDIILVHGDTSSAAACALAAFHRQIRIGHVEAGLRSRDLQQPYPEEMNRRLIDMVAHWHFAPTACAKKNLQAEGLVERVWVTGNTAIDSLAIMTKKLSSSVELTHQLEATFPFLEVGSRLILVTGHRRENIGDGFKQICEALIQIARLPNIQIIYPLHLNPAIRETVLHYLSGYSNIYITNPMNYQEFIWLMKKSSLILTDSGGVQEEGAFLGKPILVLRNVTERTEALSSGLIELVGTDSELIYTATKQRLNLNLECFKPSKVYGDGHASVRIVDALFGRKVCEYVI